MDSPREGPDDMNIINISQDSGLRTGLFNTKLQLEILHHDYIGRGGVHMLYIDFDVSA